jgi:hypothetical protein
MGCWGETCALTQTPIFRDDEVVVVAWDSRVLTRWPSEWTHKRGVEPMDGEYLRAIIKGKYNEYGWVQETDAPPSPKRGLACMFFHRIVWDAAQQREADIGSLYLWQKFSSTEEKIMGDEWDTLPVEEIARRLTPVPNFTDEQLTEYLHVLRIAQATRRNLFAAVSCGMQEGDNWDTQEWLLSYSVGLLSRQQERWLKGS